MWSQRGFTFIEVLTAIMISSSMIAVILPIVTQLTNEYHRHEAVFQAGLIAQSALEQLKTGSLPMSNRLYTEQRNNDNYTVILQVSPYGSGLMAVEVIVEWETIRSERESIQLHRLFPAI